MENIGISKRQYWDNYRKEQAAGRRKRLARFFAVIGILAAALFWSNVLKPELQYRKALSYEKEGNCVKAFAILKDLGDYRGSQDRLNEMKPYYKTNAFRVAEIGDSVYFGTYEQDGNNSNGTEDMEWIVLDKKGNKLLIFSRYGIDCQPNQRVGSEDQFNRVWADCYWRQWLNRDFYNMAFDGNEQEKIATVNIYPGSGMRPGDSGNGVAKQSAMTQDKVFLLDVDEIVKYFEDAKDRTCKPTEFAKQQGVQSDHPANFQTMPEECFWWTRTNCNTGSRFFGVDYYGNIHGVNGSTVPAMRPAMWVEIS